MGKKKVIVEDEEADWEIDEEEGAEEEQERQDGRSFTKMREQKRPKVRMEKDPKLPKKGKAVRKDGVKGIFKWAARIIIVIIIVVLLFAPGHPFKDIRDATGLDSLKDLMRPYRQFPAWVNVTVEMEYDLVVKNGRADEITIQVAPPFDLPSENDLSRESMVLQDVLDVQMTPAPYSPLKDWNTNKNTMTSWRITEATGLYKFIAKFDLKLYSYEWEITEEESGTVADIPGGFEQYLDDDWVVEKNDEPVDEDDDGEPDFYRYHPSSPVIKDIAVKITADEETVLGKVRAIYDWMREHFNYTNQEQRRRDELFYGSYPKYPLGCLADWYGDCDDQSLLMASLCRAVSIPAWLEIGYLYDPNEDDPNSRWGGHGWFNVLIPLKGAQGDYIIAPIDPVNSEFFFRDPFRITDWIDNGDYIDTSEGPKFNLDYYYNYFSVRRSSDVDVLMEPPIIKSIKYEPHGNVKKYVDEKIEPGNLPGSEQQISLPSPSPFLLLPVSALILVPALRRAISRRT